MMQIRLVVVGRLKESYWKSAVDEYLKRLKPFAKVEMLEVEDEKCPENLSYAQEQQVKEREGERIIKALLPNSYVIALNLEGREYTSEEFASYLENMAITGRSQLSFIIGGSLGLSENVLQRADLKLVFSRFTFPHQLMRVILLEQIYRCFKIIRKEPYHK